MLWTRHDSTESKESQQPEEKESTPCERGTLEAKINLEVAIVNVTIRFTWDEERYRECRINGHTVVTRLRDRMVDLTH